MRAVRQGDTIRIYDSYLYRESIKEIDGRFYDADEKCWVIPLNSKNVATLGLLGATLDKELTEMAKTERGAFVSVCTHPTPRVKAKLFRHQQDAYDFALEIFKQGKAVALLADMGTGKSMMTIAITGTLEKECGVKKMLVLCPKSIVGVWEEEFRKFADYKYALTVLDGTMEKKKAAFGFMNGAALQVIVVNYESCWRLEKEITKWHPDLIVCDESMNRTKPTTTSAVERLWYNGTSQRNFHYDSSRYHALNLHSLWQGKGIEFRCFNGTTHAGKIKTYIQLCLAISHQALTQNGASAKKTVTANEKYTFRTWLLRLGMIGDEFDTARKFLLENLSGDIAFKNGRPRAAA